MDYRLFVLASARSDQFDASDIRSSIAFAILLLFDLFSSFSTYFIIVYVNLIVIHFWRFDSIIAEAEIRLAFLFVLCFISIQVLSLVYVFSLIVIFILIVVFLDFYVVIVLFSSFFFLFLRDLERNLFDVGF